MAKRTDVKTVLIIGSGPIIIGQACEFDYSGTQACKALRKLGYRIVLVNSNPATIMTDPGIADVTYIEPLNINRLEQIIEKERPDAILPNLGGQSGLNLSSELAERGILDKYGVKVIGVQIDAIKRGEDREEFKETMDSLGIGMARSQVSYSVEEALEIADRLGYPVVLRPAYTMGGTGGGFVNNPEELKVVCERGLQASPRRCSGTPGPRLPKRPPGRRKSGFHRAAAGYPPPWRASGPAGDFPHRRYRSPYTPDPASRPSSGR